MAILQISRITNRKGLQENLPQLAGAELGWAIDSRRLFIGNGTLQEGAPVIGNTEILTEYSDITVLSNYTYQDIVVGYAPQTGPTPGDPTVRTVQAKLDDFASIRDFGAQGDGITDDTAAINRALFQLYCREANTAVRRSLYFPAGTYLITSTIIIPSFAKLVGEGADCTFITLTEPDDSSMPAYVARYGDSLQQTGANIGNNGAIPPRNIEISGMTFATQLISDVFLVEDAQQCWFSSVNFQGPYSLNQLITAPSTVLASDITGLGFASTPTLICDQITVDRCRFQGMAFGIKTDALLQGITVSNTEFRTLYRGVVIQGTDQSTGVRLVHNIFDDIYREGVIFDQVSQNVSAYNLYLNVANDIGAPSPTAPVIHFININNISVGDLFQRNNDFSNVEPRVLVDTSASFNTFQQTPQNITLGNYTRQGGMSLDLLDGVSNFLVARINAERFNGFNIDYTIQRGNIYRHGRLVVSCSPFLPALLAYDDTWSQTDDPGVTLSVSQSSNLVLLRYTTTVLGLSGVMRLSLSAI